MLFAMVPLIFPSLNNRSRFRGVSSSVRWSSHASGVVLDVELLCRIVGASPYFVRVNREMSLREKSCETTFCVKTLKKFLKGPMTKDGLRLTKKTSTSFGWERELFSDIFFKNRKFFYLFFTKSSLGF